MYTPTGDRNRQASLCRVIDKAWGFSADVSKRAQAPAILNAEDILGVNAAGTGTVQLIGVDASDQVILAGGVSSAAPRTSSTANKSFVQSYCKATDATGGTTRLAYLRLYLSGAGCNGEAVRAFTTVNGVAAGTGGIHGLHATASLDATATISSSVFMGGVRATLQIDAATRNINSGVYACLIASSFIAAGNTMTSSRTSFIRVQDDGAVACPNLFDIQGAVTRKGSAVSSADGLAILLDGVTKYIMIGT
jgi:hypothetical protein